MTLESSGDDAAVNLKHLTGDETGTVRAEPDRSLGYLLGFRQSAHRDPGANELLTLRVVLHRIEHHRRSSCAGRNDIDADPLVCIVERGGLRQPSHAMLC